jgi:hypothetical protein
MIAPNRDLVNERYPSGKKYAHHPLDEGPSGVPYVLRGKGGDQVSSGVMLDKTSLQSDN